MVRLRLARRGRKRKPIYDVVAADQKAPRDGKFIEKLGTFNPNVEPPILEVNEERALHWVMVGAQPTETVRGLLSQKGVMFKKHLQVGVNKGAITQEQADERFENWLKEKQQKIQAKIDGLKKAKSDLQTARLEAEAKVNQARIDAIEAIKREAEEAAAAAEAEAKAAEEAAAAESTEAEAPAEGEPTEASEKE